MSTDKMREALTELKARAQLATPGPWTHSRFGALIAGPVQHYTNGSGQEQIALMTGANWMRKDEHIANAEFIAAANPTAILELIDMFTTHAAEIEILTRALSGSRSLSTEYFDTGLTLHAEIARLTRQLAAATTLSNEHFDTILTQQALIEAGHAASVQGNCALDAQRYRWLRDNNIVANVQFHFASGESPYLYADALDEAIDHNCGLPAIAALTESKK